MRGGGAIKKKQDVRDITRSRHVQKERSYILLQAERGRYKSRI